MNNQFLASQAERKNATESVIAAINTIRDPSELMRLAEHAKRLAEERMNTMMWAGYVAQAYVKDKTVLIAVAGVVREVTCDCAVENGSMVITTSPFTVTKHT